ncbi:hypothetical protein DMENIID0001_119570 [Sergentomyia squamirostris]
MVPQHSQEGNMTRTDIESATAAADGLRIVFGSQLVDKNSSTPYSDATKVSVQNFFNQCVLLSVSVSIISVSSGGKIWKLFNLIDKVVGGLWSFLQTKVSPRNFLQSPH